MNTGQRLLKSSIIGTANFALQISIAFIMTPIIIHSLGDRMYGLWVLIGTLIGYYGLLDLGLFSAVSRYVSRALGKNDSEEMNNVVNTAVFLFTIIGFIALIISIIIAISCHYFIKNPEEANLFRKVIIILGINIAIGFPLRVFYGVLVAYLRYDLSLYANMTRIIVANLLIYYFVKIGHGILTIAIITSFASLLEYTLFLVFAKKICPQVRITHFCYKKHMVKVLFGYSWKTFIAKIADILRFRIDSFVIAGFLNLRLVTYYSVGAKLLVYFTNFIITTIGIMIPVFSQYESRGDFDSIRKKFLNVTKISVILSVFIGTSIIYYGKVFIHRWMGPSFESSYYVAMILCIPFIIELMQNPSIGLLYGISKHHYYSIANTCEGILNLILSIILVKYYGIYGVALGTAIEMIIFKLFIHPIVICRTINISIYEYCFKTLFLTTIKTLVPLLIYFYIVKDSMKAEYLSIFISVCFQTMFFIPIVYFFVLGKDERQLIKSSVGIA